MAAEFDRRAIAGATRTILDNIFPTKPASYKLAAETAFWRSLSAEALRGGKFWPHVAGDKVHEQNLTNEEEY
jgi:hypothetical protein